MVPKFGFDPAENLVALRVEFGPKSVPDIRAPPPPPSRLSKRLRAAREAGLGCDLCFLAENGEKVPAHRFLLQRSALRALNPGEIPVSAAAAAVVRG